jgi:hypothetical protein
MITRHMLRRVDNERYFYMHMSHVTSSHFTKYFCDIYSEYITPCTVMIYVTSNGVDVTPRVMKSLINFIGLLIKP